MERFTLRVLAVAAILPIVFAAPAAASAQQIIIHHRYNNAVSVRALMSDVERESNSFRELYEHRYHEIFLSNWRRSDDTRKAIQALDRSLEHVQARNQAGEKPKYIRDDVGKVIDRARVVNQLMNHPDDVLATMKNEWVNLKESINDLAAMYDLAGVD
jgi:hypothetical protein